MNDWWMYLLVAGAVLLIAYKLMKQKRKVYQRIPDRDFPETWKHILVKRVPFYQALSSADKVKFEYQVHVFLLNYKITGNQTEVTDLDRILVASGAVIPIFRLPKWHYLALSEVVVFPDKFQIPTTDKMARGLVGWGEMEGQMWLSRKALYEGFHIENDEKNVAIHEFIHLMDMQDGVADGVLDGIMDENDIIPWLELIKVHSDRIDNRNSSIRDYAKANPVEFLATTGEYYFESPNKLKSRDPKLYRMLDKIFNPSNNWF